MRRNGLTIFAVAVAIGAAVVASAIAFSPSGAATGFRVSFTGTDGDDQRTASVAAVAYNSARREYLVAFEADETVQGEFDIFAQRVSATGNLLGGVIRVSNVGTDGDDARDASDPAIAYNSKSKQYLVVFDGDGLATNGETEIFGQRLSGLGAPLGGDFRISTVGTDTDAARDGDNPDVAYNTTSNQYLVVWQGDPFTNDNENEIFGQRLSAAGGELGGDFQVSTQGPDGDANRDSTNPSVTYGTQGNQYLVVFQADPFTNDNEVEIFGQRLSAAGGGLGGDFNISTTGPAGDANADAVDPDVAYHAVRKQFLAVWESNPFGGGNNHFDIFGQALSPAAAKLGGNFQVSTSGPSSDENLIGTDPALAYNSRAGEFLATWTGFTFPDTTSEEIYAQRLGARGRQLDGDFRVSKTGTDGDVSRAAEFPAVAGGLNHYLVAWDSDAVSDDELEIFARRIVAPKCFGKAPTIVGTKKRDRLRGTAKADVIVGLGGPDTLIGRGGPDRLCGNKGRDTVRGGKGRDRTRP